MTTTLVQTNENEFILTDKSCWIAVDGISLYIRRDDDVGVIVEFLKVGDEAGQAIRTAGVKFEELGDSDIVPKLEAKEALKINSYDTPALHEIYYPKQNPTAEKIPEFGIPNTRGLDFWRPYSDYPMDATNAVADALAKCVVCGKTTEWPSWDGWFNPSICSRGCSDARAANEQPEHPRINEPIGFNGESHLFTVVEINELKQFAQGFVDSMKLSKTPSGWPDNEWQECTLSTGTIADLNFDLCNDEKCTFFQQLEVYAYRTVNDSSGNRSTDTDDGVQVF